MQYTEIISITGKGLRWQRSRLEKREYMMKNIHYVLANPSGNTTVFVLNPVADGERAGLAARLLRSDCIKAEQVGFLTMNGTANGAGLRIDMMGGEFCGNASRSAAAYAAMVEGLETSEYIISCSGCMTNLKANVRKRASGVYDASIEMPLPQSVDAVIIDIGGAPCRFFRVVLPGIVHFVFMGKGAAAVNRNIFWQAVKTYASGENYAAYGLILLDPTIWKMIPAVYVKQTNTLYWEHSCGSGSAAAAAAIAYMGNRNIAVKLQQPGGVIAAAAVVAKGELQYITIGGEVTLETEKIIKI
ncbi:Diaminopimelate epimerase [Megasphaera paucivorans]|uniref:Diaminopimelate epimerase n=2 Tax=Megasphaera paucivorans TaxID=349095 RepID=A0A1G9PZT9_9FIRM|nr:Diaminopimelate epimerase [Megasphaera paucivorans]